MDGYNQTFMGIDFPLIEIAGENIKLDYLHFSVLHSKNLTYGVMGAVNMKPVTEAKVVTQDRAWRKDIRSKFPQMDSAKYTELKCDRGHIISQRYPQWGNALEMQQASDDTFHLTNCSPQIPELNRGIWKQIEQWVLDKSKATALSVQTGVVAGDGFEIPIGYWKIATWLEGKSLKAAGFWVDQAGARGIAETRQVMIADIEAKAHIVNIDLSIAKADVFSGKRGIFTPTIEGAGDLVLS